MIYIDKVVPVDERYKEFLKIVSCFYEMNLSKREIEILDSFFWASEGVITTDGRRQVAINLKITPYNLNNQLGKLRKKGIVAGNESGTDDCIKKVLLPNLEPDKDDFVIGLKFKSK